MVPRAGIEPARPKRARDFKSLASTSFATEAKSTNYTINVDNKDCMEIIN